MNLGGITAVQPTSAIATALVIVRFRTVASSNTTWSAVDSVPRDSGRTRIGHRHAGVNVNLTKVSARLWPILGGELAGEARRGGAEGPAIEAAHEQHLMALRLLLGKGLEALRGMSIDAPRDAIRAIGLAVREIRVELGEPPAVLGTLSELPGRNESERKVTSKEIDPEAEPVISPPTKTAQNIGATVTRKFPGGSPKSGVSGGMTSEEPRLSLPSRLRPRHVAG